MVDARDNPVVTMHLCTSRNTNMRKLVDRHAEEQPTREKDFADGALQTKLQHVTIQASVTFLCTESTEVGKR